MIDLPDTNSIYSMADFIELSVIYGNKPMSKAKIASLLQSYVTDLQADTVDSVIGELERRYHLYGDSTPFAINGDRIGPVVKWEKTPELLMCLIFSLNGVRKKKGIDDGTKLFERISNEAVKLYLGGEAEVIGFPNENKLIKQIAAIAEKTSESIGHRKPNPKDKDKGVDIIAWKTHGDNRPNQIVLLLQCGAGIHVSNKKPISIQAWHEFMHWSATPIQGIMIPRIVSSEELTELRDDYNLIFDRVRICKAVYKKPLYDTTLRKQILNWCKSNI
jgi:hypothetical protein